MAELVHILLHGAGVSTKVGLFITVSWIGRILQC